MNSIYFRQENLSYIHITEWRIFMVIGGYELGQILTTMINVKTFRRNLCRYRWNISNSFTQYADSSVN